VSKRSPAADCPDTTALTIASPIAPPSWKDVWTSPEASPCSRSATPDTAWMFSTGNRSMKPIPISSIVGKRTAT